MILLDFFRDNIKGNIIDIKYTIALTDVHIYGGDDDLGIWSEGEETELFLSELDEQEYYFLGMPDKRNWHKNKDIVIEAVIKKWPFSSIMQG